MVCLGRAFGNHFKLTEMEVNDKDLKMRIDSSFLERERSVGATSVLELIFPFSKIFVLCSVCSSSVRGARFDKSGRPLQN